jgi:hypothetical protein
MGCTSSKPAAVISPPATAAAKSTNEEPQVENETNNNAERKIVGKLYFKDVGRIDVLYFDFS